MASPFRHFRKHSKAFMASAAVMCMFLFVFASGTGQRGGSDDARLPGATVATWDGGSINQRELAAYVENRLVTDEFLQRLYSQGGGSPQGYDLPPAMHALFLGSRRTDYVEMEAIAVEVVSRLAADAGMTVSDDMVNHVLETVALKNVSGDEMAGIFASLGQRDALGSEAVVFNTLRKMLLAFFYRQAYQDAGNIVLPEERWEDWRQVNERISLTAAALPVESFEAAVPEPTDDQLQAFYQEHKANLPYRWMTVDGRDMPSSQPGFTEPRRVRLQFVVASVAEATEKRLADVTDAEITDYYERNKRSEFVKMGFGDDPPSDAPADDATADDAPADDAPAEDEAAGDAAPSESADEADAQTPPAEDAPQTPPAEDAPAASEPPAEDAPAASEPPAAETPAETPAEPAAKDGASAASPSPFRLAAYQAETTAPPAAASDASSSDASDANEGGDDDAAAQGGAADDSAATVDAPAGPAADAESADSSSDSSTAAGDDETLEFEPLEKVRDEIRRTLARNKAVEKLGDSMDEAAAQLQAAYNRYGIKVAAAKEEKRTPPAPPKELVDLQWLADKYGFRLEKTAPLTDRELFETAVGKAADAARGVSSVTRAAFLELDLYQPLLARELEGDWYLVAKVEDTPSRVPELAEVRDAVAAAWRRREAATLAEKRAKELAEEVKKSGQSFEEFFKAQGFEVIPQTELFSWRTAPLDPSTGAPPSLSEVAQLKHVGPDFMQTAFALGDGEVASALNFDRTTAYVIKLNSRQYTQDELRELFLEEDRTWIGRFGTRMQRQRIFSQAVDREILQDRAKLEFDEEWLKLRADRAQRD